MSVSIEAIRRHIEVARSQQIPNLKERLDWANREPTIEEAVCFTDRDVAYILNVSTRTVSRLVQRGELRAFYLTDGRRTRRFSLPDVKAFIRSRVSPPIDPSP